MALNLGELVAGLRADESGFMNGLNEAQLALRGLTRDVDGRLRDMNGRFVTESEAMGQSLAYRIGRGARSAVGALKQVGAAVVAIGVGVPAVAAVGTAVGGLTAGFLAAGLAAKAFQLAAKPQLEEIANAASLAEEAQKAAASGSKDAAEKQKAYNDALAAMPPATRATAKAFIGLKSDYAAWSDEMSATTMPVFTKGIEILRALLPSLTPFVKAAAGAIGGFLDDVGRGVKSAGFKEWAADMAAASGPALKNFLTAIKNIAVGIGGLLQAFLPASAGVTGGLVEMTGAFASWGTSLKGSAGFAQFLALAQQGAGVLGTFAQAALQLLVALSPLIGVTSQVAMWLAQLINMIPPDVLAAIGTAFAIIALGVKAYALAMTIASAATRAWAAAQLIFNAVMAANPIGIVIALIIALAAAVVIAYQKSETFRSIVQAVWSAVKAGITSAVNAIKGVLNWFGTLPSLMSGWWRSAKDAAVRQALSLVSWVRGLPGRAKDALGDMGRVLIGAGKALIRGFINGVKGMFSSVKNTLGDLTSSLTSWKGPENVDKRLLTPAGRMVIAGFQRGIDAQIPALRGQLQGLTGLLPEMALAGGEFGRDRTMSGLVSTPAPGQYGMGAGAPGAATGYGSASQTPQVVVLKGSGSAFDEAFIAQLRHVDQKLGGALFQVA
jgi:hypothetical protein